MEIRIAIVENEHHQAQYNKMLVNKWAIENNIDVTIDMFENAENFKIAWRENDIYDIALLDIEMGGQNGVELAREIRQSDTKLVIVFITGYVDYMSQGFDVDALHFLVKPIKEDKFFSVLQKAKQSLAQANKSLTLAIDGTLYRLPLEKIRYIEAQDHYVLIKAVSQEYKTKMNLSDVQKSLDDSFFKCQRSFIVNLRFVYKISRTGIVLDDMTEVPLSRDLYEAANRAVIKFFPD